MTVKIGEVTDRKLLEAIENLEIIKGEKQFQLFIQFINITNENII